MRGWGWLLHLGVGAALGFLAAYAGTLVGVVGLLFVLGFLREQAQHDWRLTAHQWLEALAWGVGGLLGALGCRLL